MAEESIRPLPISWDTDEAATAQFVNNLLVTFDGANYIIRFYQVLPPAIHPSDTEAWAELKNVRAKHIITLVVSAGNMPDIVAALQRSTEHPISTLA